MLMVVKLNKINKMSKYVTPLIEVVKLCGSNIVMESPGGTPPPGMIDNPGGGTNNPGGFGGGAPGRWF